MTCHWKLFTLPLLLFSLSPRFLVTHLNMNWNSSSISLQAKARKRTRERECRQCFFSKFLSSSSVTHCPVRSVINLGPLRRVISSHQQATFTKLPNSLMFSLDPIVIVRRSSRSNRGGEEVLPVEQSDGYDDPILSGR